MKRYWNMTGPERAALTEDAVRDLLAVELMERGVLRPREPELEAVPEEVRLPTQTVYRIGYGYGHDLGFAFQTAEAAESLMSMLLFDVANDYEAGTNYVEPLKGMRVESVQLPTKEAVEHHKLALKERKRIVSSNEARTREYREALSKVEEETTELWSDWREQRDLEKRRAEVRETMEGYVRLTGGDRVLARTFLEKVYPRELCDEALGPGARVVAVMDVSDERRESGDGGLL